ncbi:MAG: hypothetical protein GY744_08915 [Gammaproteobacteria bacterium]|nr:hypothetical protein [Gammaproteobacteria bacterium]
MQFPNIESLIDCDGQISIGNIHPNGSIAVANDQENTLVMLKSRPDESILELLSRLDQAIELAIEDEIITDEVNS